MAALDRLVLVEGAQHPFQGGLVDLHPEVGADDREGGVVGDAFGEVVAENGAQQRLSSLTTQNAP